MRRQLQPGQVLYLYCEFTHPHKDKFLVVAYAAPILGLLVINSEIPEYIQKRSPLKQCEVKIDVASHGFLAYDSYIDCQQVITSLTKDHMEKQLLNDMSRLKGMIAESVREQVIAAVKACEKLKPREKNRVLTAFADV